MKSTESGLDKQISIATRNMTEAIVSGKWFALTEKTVRMPDGSVKCDINERDLQNLCVEAVTEILAQAVQEALLRERSKSKVSVDSEYELPDQSCLVQFTQNDLDQALAKQKEELVENIESYELEFGDGEAYMVKSGISRVITPEFIIDLIKDSTKEEE